MHTTRPTNEKATLCATVYGKMKGGVRKYDGAVQWIERKRRFGRGRLGVTGIWQKDTKRILKLEAHRLNHSPLHYSLVRSCDVCAFAKGNLSKESILASCTA